MTAVPARLDALDGPVVAIVNPHASRLRNPVRRAAVLADLDAWTRQATGQPPLILTAIDAASADAAGAEAVRAGAGLVVVVGGDGTASAVAVDLADTGTPVAIIPAGTGNVLAHALGIPNDPHRAFGALREALVRPIDLGIATLDRQDASLCGQITSDCPVPVARTTRLFSVAAGVGWDARVVGATVAPRKHRLGRLAYWAAAAGQLGELGPVPYELDLDGECLELEATLVLVANCGELIPGLVRPRLRIVPDDGLLDVLILRVGSVVGGLRGLFELLSRTELGGSPSGQAVRLRCRRIRIQARPDQPRQVDGDGFGAGSLEATVQPGALQVLVPRRDA